MNKLIFHIMMTNNDPCLGQHKNAEGGLYPWEVYYSTIPLEGVL